MSLFPICEEEGFHAGYIIAGSAACANDMLSATITPERHGTIGSLEKCVAFDVRGDLALRPLPQHRRGASYQVDTHLQHIQPARSDGVRVTEGSTKFSGVELAVMAC
jgi:hypothetical protein